MHPAQPRFAWLGGVHNNKGIHSKQSCIWETGNLLTCADSSTNTNKAEKIREKIDRGFQERTNTHTTIATYRLYWPPPLLPPPIIVSVSLQRNTFDFNIY